MTPASPPLSEKPDPYIDREPLRSATAAEPVLDTQHPFIAYKETHRASGAWRVRIHSRRDATTVLYPNAMRLQARATTEQGKTSFTWTNTAIGSSGDAERVTFRVHVNNGQPAAIEVLPHEAATTVTGMAGPVKFAWPTA